MIDFAISNKASHKTQQAPLKALGSPHNMPITYVVYFQVVTRHQKCTRDLCNKLPYTYEFSKKGQRL